MSVEECTSDPFKGLRGGNGGVGDGCWASEAGPDPVSNVLAQFVIPKILNAVDLQDGELDVPFHRVVDILMTSWCREKKSLANSYGQMTNYGWLFYDDEWMFHNSIKDRKGLRRTLEFLFVFGLLWLWTWIRGNPFEERECLRTKFQYELEVLFPGIIRNWRVWSITDDVEYALSTVKDRIEEYKLWMDAVKLEIDQNYNNLLNLLKRETVQDVGMNTAGRIWSTFVNFFRFVPAIVVTASLLANYFGAIDATTAAVYTLGALIYCVIIVAICPCDCCREPPVRVSQNVYVEMPRDESQRAAAQALLGDVMPDGSRKTGGNHRFEISLSDSTVGKLVSAFRQGLGSAGDAANKKPPDI